MHPQEDFLHNTHDSEMTNFSSVFFTFKFKGWFAKASEGIIFSFDMVCIYFVIT